MLCALPLLLVFGLAEPQAPAASPAEAFSRAWDLAAANIATPAGKAYDASLGKFAAAHHTPLMDACFAATGKPDRTKFRLALKVAADGSIESAFANPETNISLCFRDKLKQTKLPSPPAAGYWVQVEMTLGQ